MVDISEYWAKGWMAKKDKLKEKVEEAKTDWKTLATSDIAEEEYRKGVEEAVREKLRKRVLEKISPEEWVSRVKEGVDAKTITAGEQEKYLKRVSPYVAYVLTKRKELKTKGIKGFSALDWWKTEVLSKMAEMRPRLRVEAR